MSPGRVLGAERAWRARVTGIERRQVFDLPPVTVTVTEHQLIERECRCGHRTRGAAPEGAQAPVQYGPRVAAVIIYLYIGQFLSRKRTAQALAELFGIPLSPGTVAGITARAAQTLDGFLEQVRENITASDVAGFDALVPVAYSRPGLRGARAPPRLTALGAGDRLLRSG